MWWRSIYNKPWADWNFFFQQAYPIVWYTFLQFDFSLLWHICLECFSKLVHNIMFHCFTIMKAHLLIPLYISVLFLHDFWNIYLISKLLSNRNFGFLLWTGIVLIGYIGTNPAFDYASVNLLMHIITNRSMWLDLFHYTIHWIGLHIKLSTYRDWE